MATEPPLLEKTLGRDGGGGSFGTHQQPLQTGHLANAAQDLLIADRHGRPLGLAQGPQHQTIPDRSGYPQPRCQGLGIRRLHTEDDEDPIRTYLYLRDVESNPAIEKALDTLEQRLRLGNGQGEHGPGVEVVFGPYFRDGRTIAMQTMSIMDILTESSAYILVPEEHVAEGRTRPNRVVREDDDRSRPLLWVYSSLKKPEDALVSVKSRGYWYYIDDRDIDSKKTFSFLMIIMQLTAAQQQNKGPAVTIGAGN